MLSKIEREDFNLAGPKYLTSINWSCPNEQRIVVACLVKGVYILERDRQENRRGSNAHAPAWWERFDFRLIRQFHDDCDSSIAGAIYEYINPFSSAKLGDHFEAPKYIFAFRGTMRERETIVKDLFLDFRLIMSSLHKSSRYRRALEALTTLTAVVGDNNVWLAGHSLGASLVTLAGKHFAKEGIHLKSFLFNPPFVTSAIEILPGLNDKVRDKIRSAKKGIRVGAAKIIKSHESKTTELFDRLALWVPNVFINPGDPICSEYVNYFRQRKMEIQQGRHGKHVSLLSVRDICWNFIGVESERHYLFPSARVMVNMSGTESWMKYHAIDQWWQPDLNLESSYSVESEQILT